MEGLFRMRRLRTSLILAVGLIVATTGMVGAAPNDGVKTDVSGYNGPTVDTSSALVRLNGDPLSTYVKTKPAQGKKLDLTSNAAKSYRSQLSAYRNQFKQWLQTNAPKAKITGSWDLSVNAVSVQLNGTKLSTLAAAPQVQHVEYVGLYHKLVNNPDLELVNAYNAWTSAGGVGAAGEGVKVGMIDAGIDIHHPCFNDSTYGAVTQLGDTNFTNNKVIVARVFNNKTPSRHYTPEAIDSHGTFTAGIVACNANTGGLSVDGAAIPFAMSGIAPRALLGNYNVFPADVENVRSEDLINALEAAFGDGMDIINMSLGGGSGGIQDLVTMAVDDLDQAGMISTISAGNSGEGNDAGAHPAFPPGHYTIESPGSAARALTAGSSTVGQLVMSLVLQAGHTYATDRGDFNFPPVDLTKATVEAPSGTPATDVGNHNDGCAPYGSDVTDKIVLVARGVCTFATKVQNAQAAHAAAVIVVNRDAEPIPMADDPALGNTIPAVMVGHDDGIALYGNIPANATITAPTYVAEPNPVSPISNVVSSFSSQGPTDVDFRVKPDIMAPGQHMISSIPISECEGAPCWAVFDGTSFSAPQLAGAAAVVKAAHPTWGAAMIRSAIVNTAATGQLTEADGSTPVTDPNVIGSGLLDVDAAVHAWVALDPVSVSFGAVPSGSGTSDARTVTITNLKGFTYNYQLAVGVGSGGVHYSLSVTHINLAAGQSGTFQVLMTSDKGAAFGDHYVDLTVSGVVGPYAHAVVYTFIK